MNKKEYSVYGTFRVTTEGDCDGKSIRDLGIYEGYIDEIAFALADKCYYSLEFRPAEKPPKFDMTPKSKEVNICLDFNSGTQRMEKEDRVKYFEKLFNGRNVDVSYSNEYGCVKISAKE